MKFILLDKLKYHKVKSGSMVLLTYRFVHRSARRLHKKLTTLIWRYYLHSTGQNCIIDVGAKFEQPVNITLGKSTYIGCNSVFKSELFPSSLIVGDHVQINEGCRVDHSGGLIIGDNVVISENSKVYTHSHGYHPKSKPVAKQLIIGSNVWVGSNVIITEGCEYIAEGVIIGAGSIVTKTLPEKYCLYAGCPAKKIKRIKT